MLRQRHVLYLLSVLTTPTLAYNLNDILALPAEGGPSLISDNTSGYINYISVRGTPSLLYAPWGMYGQSVEVHDGFQWEYERTIPNVCLPENGPGRLNDALTNFLQSNWYDKSLPLTYKGKNDFVQTLDAYVVPICSKIFSITVYSRGEIIPMPETTCRLEGPNDVDLSGGSPQSVPFTMNCSGGKPVDVKIKVEGPASVVVAPGLTIWTKTPPLIHAKPNTSTSVSIVVGYDSVNPAPGKYESIFVYSINYQ